MRLQELSPAERSLLSALDLNGDASIAALARQTGLSRDRVSARLERWREAGLVRGFTTVLDIGRLGYTGVAVFARLARGKSAERHRTMEILRKHPRVYWLAELWGPYDVLFALQVRNMVEFAEILGEIQAECRLIAETESAVRIRVTQFARSYLRERSIPRKTLLFSGASAEPITAEPSHALLQKIIADPRIGVQELADAAELSRPTVYAHRERLRTSGVISGTSCQIESLAIGYTPYHLLVRVRRAGRDVTERIRNFAKGDPHMVFCIETIGRWQFELGCEIGETSDLQQTIGRFREELQDVILDIDLVPFSSYYAKYAFSL